MSGELCLRNRHRTRAVDLRLFRRIAQHLLAEHFRHDDYELGVHLVATPEMTRLNEHFLQHAGSTDVITFDYADNAGPASGGNRWNASQVLWGEIYICFDEAVSQARRFRAAWQSELVRYLIHGLLHLHGHDDLNPAARRRMKREENRLLRQMQKRFPIRSLARMGRSSRPNSQS